MAGHSKWANIKHRKAGQDAKRGKIFTKLIREITVAARLGGESPADNPRLRLAVDKALGANMPKDTIDRAIKRGVGAGDDANMEEISYEGYGPGGVAVLVETLTDNKNRTVAAVRHGFSKFGGTLGTNGSVSYLFETTGIVVLAPGTDEERAMELALEAGAHEVFSQDDGAIEVQTSPDSYETVRDALRGAGLEIARAEIDRLASTSVALDQDGAEKLMKLIDHLEDLDDVQNVYSNADIDPEVAAALSG